MPCMCRALYSSYKCCSACTKAMECTSTVFRKLKVYLFFKSLTVIYLYIFLLFNENFQFGSKQKLFKLMYLYKIIHFMYIHVYKAFYIHV